MVSHSFSMRSRELVDGLPQFLNALQGVSPLLGQGAQVVPLVTDTLAAGVDCGSVMVVQLIELLGDGSDLLHSVLVSSQVALEGFMFPHQSSDLHQGGRLVVLHGQKLLLASGPALV